MAARCPTRSSRSASISPIPASITQSGAVPIEEPVELAELTAGFAVTADEVMDPGQPVGT